MRITENQVDLVITALRHLSCDAEQQQSESARTVGYMCICL